MFYDREEIAVTTYWVTTVIISKYHNIFDIKTWYQMN